MSRIENFKGPLGLKPDKPEKAPRKGMRRKSKKRAAQEASPEGRSDLEYMGNVKQEPCCACGKPGPSDAHHCKDKPPAGEPHAYKRLPIGCKSHARDTIPLCKMCHQDGPEAYHRSPVAWRAKHGPDYGFIPSTRAAVAARKAEIGF